MDNQDQIHESAVRRAAELRKQIQQHNQLYYIRARPEIQDREYDLLVAELAELEKRYPALAGKDSPVAAVGSDRQEGFETVIHPVPMLSIGNTYTADEVVEFDERIRRKLGLEAGEILEYVVELKIDGVAITLMYLDSVLQYAATRGDGVRGDEITRNIRTIRKIPGKLKGRIPRGRFEVRGEVFMKRPDFEEINRQRQEKGEEVYANPRNLTAGTLKQLNVEIVANRPLDIFIYSSGAVDGDLPATHAGFLVELKQLGLPVNDHFEICRSVDDVLKAVESWEVRRRDLVYDTDGLVIKLNKMSLYKPLGSTSKSPRWMVAYKFSAEQAQTRLENIDVQVGRTGAITPVAHLKPVFLAGSTISRASLHNADEIERKGIRVGDQVIIEKGGDIIPKVVRVLDSLRTGKEKVFKYPRKCPVCSSDLVRPEGEAAHYCINRACPAQVKEGILHYASRRAMDVDGLGEKIVDQLVESELVHDLSDLYNLRVVDLSGLERMAKKSALNLVDAIDASRGRLLGRLLFGLGIRYVGETAARLLVRHFKDIEALMKAGQEELEAIDGVGIVMAQSIRDFFSQAENLDLIRRLKEAGLNTVRTVDEQPAGDDTLENSLFADKTCVLTGKLEKMGRSQAGKLIESLGGKSAGSVSAKTDLLIAGPGAGTKLKKAEELGVETVDEETFLEMLKKSGWEWPGVL
jgi:DNA ligase (NAD+)